MSAPPLRFRPARASDEPFIYSSWLRSYHEGGVAARFIERDVFMEGQKMLIARLLRDSATWVAHPEGDDETICGWLCGAEEYADVSETGAIVHYVYVKSCYRGLGVMRGLLEAVGIGATVETTHLTRAVLQFREHGHDWRFNPFYLMEA